MKDSVTGTVCQVRAGEKHSLRNLSDDDMLVLTIYDPPRNVSRWDGQNTFATISTSHGVKDLRS